ncbi:stromelysin-1 [Caerostris extrusa]|uniref:Stromelysin-1 n=1 Tax=Caerostris extrusa TaxID=172846 RepID=A0AAV4Y0M0_CAEEX|nr:stromelysin-1 [Caerostris extrusa]
MRTGVPLVLVGCCLLIASFSFPINDEGGAALYLHKFGYLEDNGYRVGALVGPETISSAIKDFQRFAGINQTGTLDNDTLTMMNTPRCGVKDKIGSSAFARRRKRYAFASKWRTTDLTYRILKYPAKLKDRTKVEKEIARAFKVWSDVSTLSFQEKKSGRANIIISFERRDHGDGDPFDGPGKTLAHAFFPQFGGDAHFDDEEKWTVSEMTGTNLFQVAAHEFGHSLGLSHSDIKEALMAPYYRGFQPILELDNDDVEAIQSLYGSSYQPTPTDEDIPPGPPPDISDAPDLCQDARIDTVTRTQNGSTYVFKGQFYWKILPDAIADGYPRKIVDDWRGLEGNLDASLTWSNGKTFFLRNMDSGYPKLLSRGFEGIPDMLDAAFVWSGNGKTYFLKVINTGAMTAIMILLRTYFFKGNQYYRFNDVNFQVDTSDPPFPRSTSVWWFECKSISHKDDSIETSTHLQEIVVRDNNTVIRIDSNSGNL